MSTNNDCTNNLYGPFYWDPQTPNNATNSMPPPPRPLPRSLPPPSQNPSSDPSTTASMISPTPSTRLPYDKLYELSMKTISFRQKRFQSAKRGTKNQLASLQALRTYWVDTEMKKCMTTFETNTRCKKCGETSSKSGLINHIRTDRLTLLLRNLMNDMDDTDLLTINQERMDNFIVRWLEAEEMWYKDNRILRTKNAQCEGLYEVQNRAEKMKDLMRKEGWTGLRSRP